MNESNQEPPEPQPTVLSFIAGVGILFIVAYLVGFAFGGTVGGLIGVTVLLALQLLAACEVFSEWSAPASERLCRFLRQRGVIPAFPHWATQLSFVLALVCATLVTAALLSQR